MSAEVAKNTMTIKPCSCKSEYQDSVYGKGMRAKNSVGGKNGAGSFRCTVCGKVVQ